MSSPVRSTSNKIAPPSTQEVRAYYKAVIDTLRRTAVEKNGVKYLADGQRLSVALKQAREAREWALSTAVDGTPKMAVINEPNSKGVVLATVTSFTDPSKRYGIAYKSATRQIKCDCESFKRLNWNAGSPTIDQTSKLCKHCRFWALELMPCD